MIRFPNDGPFGVCAIAAIGLLAAASAAPAQAEPSAVWKDGWTINVPGDSRKLFDGAASGFTPAQPSTRYSAGLNADPYSYGNYSLGHTLGIAREYGLGNVQATLGVRMADPLATNGFTPSIDPRRYMGVGPRIGFEGTNEVSSNWVVDWKVGASVLNGGQSFDAAGVTNPSVPSFAAKGSVLNVDGLLGLSYFFDSASKLTVGYRADYFKGDAALNLSGTGIDSGERINHGPMVRFSIQR